MNMHSTEQGRLLTALARQVIASEFEETKSELPHPDWLDQPGAVFVTLTQNGQLRGCIGSLEAHRSLFNDLQSNARAAAFKDPRFPPLTQKELAGIQVEVSLLSPATSIQFTDEDDALAQLRPGIDGVILEHGWHRATFLPQVWEQLPDPRDFISHLKRKAGLAVDFWADDLHLSRYLVEKFKEAT
jgi:AmmeMemoRadiSam system protein A